MKLNYYFNSEKEKIYTLKTKIDNKEIKPAHHKFLKLKLIPKEKYKPKK